jgi:hypothetical protein
VTCEIESFIDEVREAGKVRGLLTEEHIEIIRTALVNGHAAAGESVELMELWDDVRDVIADRSKAVKWRLEQMGKVADLWNEKHGGSLLH